MLSGQAGNWGDIEGECLKQRIVCRLDLETEGQDSITQGMVSQMTVTGDGYTLLTIEERSLVMDLFLVL